MASKEIAVFGGSFNPPTKQHAQIARVLAEHFDEVIIIPCGPRADKPSTNEIPSVYRAAMCDLAFSGIPKCKVELFDLENLTFTRSQDLYELYSRDANAWLVVGADLLSGGKHQASQIQSSWKNGRQLWQEAQFVVISRPGHVLDEEDLPARSQVIKIDYPGSSSDVRKRAAESQPFKDQLDEKVAAFVERHNLYSVSSYPPTVQARFPKSSLELIYDTKNSEAAKHAKLYSKLLSEDPELLLVIGGDGTMLRAIRNNWRRRLPFYGLNAGHTGFLLNSPGKPIVESNLILHFLPLLWVEAETMDGTLHSGLAFNDAWVERASGQSAWISVSVNGEIKIDRLVADGALVATASGSPAYARAMGAAPIPFNTPVLLLVGSNVFKPYDWRFAVLPIDHVVEFHCLDPKKRPLTGFIDGQALGPTRRMKIRLSRSAAVELAFEPEFDPGQKLAQLQFPSF